MCEKERGGKGVQNERVQEGGMERKGEGAREMSMQERECARERGERVCESERVE